MIRDYQQRRRMERIGPPPQTSAIIMGIAGSRAFLKFNDGYVSQKMYRLNTGCDYRVGQRVAIRKISGTYLIEYPLG